jgi:hypothetical protein
VIGSSVEGIGIGLGVEGIGVGSNRIA